MGVAEDRVDRVGIRAAALEREQGVDDAVEPFVRLVAEDLEELGLGVWLERSCRAAASCGEEPLDVDDSDEPPSSRAAPRAGSSWVSSATGGERADVGDLVDREAGAKPAVLGDDEALREAVAPDPEHAREIEDGQHLAVQVPDAEDGSRRLPAPATAVPSSATSSTFSTGTA